MLGEFKHSDISSKTEVSDYKQIKPKEGTTIEHAQNFWDNLFSKTIGFFSGGCDSENSELKKNSVDTFKDINDT